MGAFAEGSVGLEEDMSHSSVVVVAFVKAGSRYHNPAGAVGSSDTAAHCMQAPMAVEQLVYTLDKADTLVSLFEGAAASEGVGVVVSMQGTVA